MHAYSGGVFICVKNEHHPKPAAWNLQHTTNWEQDDRSGNSTTQSQAPDDGYINIRNILSTYEVKYHTKWHQVGL